MIKKVKASLTIKIFLLISFLLTAASLITYVAIARFLPVTYSSQLEKHLDQMSEELAKTIGGFWTIEDAGTAIELFEASYNVSIVILDGFGERVWPAVDAIAYEYDSEIVDADSAVEEYYGVTVASDIYLEDTAELDVQAQEGVMTDVDTGFGQEKASAVKKYDVTLFGGDRYTMMVSGGMQPVSQAMEIIRQIFPYILSAAVIVAVLAALAASVYLTGPVVKLSRISRKMAQLDFDYVYQGKRTDEVGILGRNLNEMSGNLSSTLNELQKANDKLRSDIELERELEKKRIVFFSSVSHELKTPITILKGHLLGMIQGIGDYKNREYYLHRSLETADKMEDMVQELLSVSRMESKPFTMQRTDLAELLRLQLAELVELAEEKGLVFELNIPEHLEVNVNVSVMEKVFRNLLINAIRYTPEREENQIRVWLRRNPSDSSIYCEVENTGVHIPEEALSHLFEAFYRVEQSRNRQMGGSGLGLYIVKMALDRHGAEYGIENSAEGVKVYFRIQGEMPENSI